MKLAVTRKQLFFANGHRPETEQRVALGASADGKLVSIIHEGIGQGEEPLLYNGPQVVERHTIGWRGNLRRATAPLEGGRGFVLEGLRPVIARAEARPGLRGPS